MELARAMELAHSFSNDILGKLYKEIRPDFFTGVSLAYWQQISNKIYWSLYFEVVQIHTWSLLQYSEILLFFSKLCQTSHKWYLHITKTPSSCSMYCRFTKQVSLGGIVKHFFYLGLKLNYADFQSIMHRTRGISTLFLFKNSFFKHLCPNFLLNSVNHIN